ncbi:MAG: sensor histidine kinase [Pseudomonadota bacterium]
MKELIGQLSPTSVRGQLLIWLIGPLLLIGAIAIYDGYRAARATADSVSDRVLSGSALAIAERVFVNDDNDLEVDIPYVALQMLTSSEDDRVFYKIETDAGAFITGYRDLRLPKPDPTQLEVAFSNDVFRGEPIRIATFIGAASSNTKSLGYRVGVAETTNARAAIARAILLRSLARQAALILGVAALIWFAVARALRPLRRLETAVGRRSPEDVRPIEHVVPNEVQGLVSTINELVGRFASSIRALENFTSNASHQFRTPLALIKTHLEVAARETKPGKRGEAIQQAHKAVGEAERLMSQMLMLARLDASSTRDLRNQTCDLAQVAREVCEEFVLQMAHHGRSDVDLGFQAEDAVNVYAEKTLAHEVVRNLIDNAIKHSGASPKVDVQVTTDGMCGTVCIRDSGNGFELESGHDGNAHGNARLLKSSDTRPGLGLAIVKEIVTLLKGELTATKSSTPSGMVVKAAFKAAH